MHCEKPQNPVPFPCAPCEIKLSQAEIFLETQKCSKKHFIKKILDSQVTSTTDDSTDVESSTSLVYKLKDNKWTRPDTSPSTSS